MRVPACLCLCVFCISKSRWQCSHYNAQIHHANSRTKKGRAPSLTFTPRPNLSAPPCSQPSPTPRSTCLLSRSRRYIRLHGGVRRRNLISNQNTLRADQDHVHISTSRPPSTRQRSSPGAAWRSWWLSPHSCVQLTRRPHNWGTAEVPIVRALEDCMRNSQSSSPNFGCQCSRSS